MSRSGGQDQSRTYQARPDEGTDASPSPRSMPRNGQQVRSHPSTAGEQQAPPGEEPKKDITIMSRNRVILESLFMIGGMVTYVADLVTDVLVALQYLFLDEYAWCGLTIAFIVIPSFTIQYLSFRWFVVDSMQAPETKHVSFLKKVMAWIVWLAVHILQLGILKRYWRSLKYAWKSREKPDYYDLSVYEYRDITMLRLLESFMECAPQLVLQIYIMTQQREIYWLTVSSALVSLASLAWGIEAYHKALRESCINKNNLGYVGMVFRMAWRTFTITARVISMALFSAFNVWLFIPLIAVHYVGMTLWLVYQDTDFCTTKLEEVLFDAVIGVIHIFCFFNMKEGQTRYRALFFYSVILIENTVMFGVWYHFIGHDEVYGLPALFFVWGGFFMGIFIMMFYYRCLHPNGNIRLWGSSSSIAKSSPTENGTSHAYDNNARDETDGPLRWDEIIVPSSSRGCHGNLFTHKGRRYCYWRETTGSCPCDDAPSPRQGPTTDSLTRQPTSHDVEPDGVNVNNTNNIRRDCDCSQPDGILKAGRSKERLETLL